MTITDDVRKTLSDPTPLYAVAGLADLAQEKLREVPALVEKLREQAPERIQAVRETDPKVARERVAERAKEAQAKVHEALANIDTDVKKLRENAQDLALQGVGRAAEYAVKAREAYDELAERGRGAVQAWQGRAADDVEYTAEVVRPAPEPVIDAEPKPKPEAKAAPAAKKTTARRTTAAKKTAAAKKTEPKNES
ncbi:hypothetical protein SRB5_65040 [Streptomyces sp. RB5]|uniref:Heparin-binding hemagglutinin n=1 Tax=Streptomyces smaragdinus TaxID=2585196 RepID=A0A7K0CS29_9ACTN|nr:hypothetical protein [Streptomyces smaragdinus]MQY16306.1 hypothetical protein [Streptomyces smaragdinus]